MIISLIAAMDLNRAIGYKNQLPWKHLPADWDNLKKVTAGKKMIMGRRSYESPDRLWSEAGNVVITRQPDYQTDKGFLVADTLEKALQLVGDVDEIFILGGEEIFRISLPLADRIYLTIVKGTFQADAFFPEFIVSDFQIIQHDDHQADSENPYDYTFIIYERK
ncbi:dihydrofolate reductase [Xanthocytophaga agilis]|uniref:Dihydrofolate reductase n=1 Tax=Xanthocytophaga agilis TaxID=3048010 RepID=A0AAE3R494_9BACT|nr:dihydrofolate reductase [Xanthocytophaga agilis]MDJ1500392.1 dihydrofolate reductase [Xanthocytophaga agilis]